MKYNDIPKLIMPNGSALCWDLCEIEDTLERWTSEDRYGLDLDPDFQRGHVWTTEQQIKFVEFILRGGKSSPVMFNSPAYGGNYRTKSWDLPDTIVIVDGKQRLEACRKFVRDDLPVFGGMYINDFEDPKVILRRTGISYMVNCINTRKELLKWYLELNEGHIAHSQSEIERVRKLYEEA